MALGRFYASQMIRLKTNATKKKSINLASGLQYRSARKISSDTAPGSLSFEYTITLDQIEVALESYANAKMGEKKSTRNRTYLMIISHITMHQRSRGLKQFSRLTTSDISIAQLLEIKQQDGRRVLKPSDAPQFQIVGRKEVGGRQRDSPVSRENSDSKAPVTPKTKSDEYPPCTPKELNIESMTITDPTEFLRACHYRDSVNHVDEVEFDVSDVIVRVTPTSIVDLTKAGTRLFDLIRLTSKEMERKVHAGRRNQYRKNEKVSGETYSQLS
jgi:hypothetical protein